MIQYLAAAGGEMSTAGSMLGMIIPLVFCGIIFYFFLYKPQTKQDQEAQRMRDELQVGDEITTTGGIIGRTRVTGTTTVKDCHYFGTMTVGAYASGGIIGCGYSRSTAGPLCLRHRSSFSITGR